MTDYTNSQMCALIDEHIHNERDRDLMKRRLCDGVICDRLAWEFSITPRQVKNIIQKNTQIIDRFL